MTILNLFEAAGFPQPEKTMIPFKKYEPLNSLEVKAYDTNSNSVVWQKVLGLYYKGMSNSENSFEVIIEELNKSFKCTGEHLLYIPEMNKYIPTKSLPLGKDLLLLGQSKIVKGKIRAIKTSFPILDMEVEKTFNYFSAGILSHNTFGAGAKLMSDALRKFNPILEKYRTSMIVISQERDAVGELYGPGYKVTGGRAIKFYASNRSRVQRIDYVKEKGVITGINMRVKNGKNKAGVPYREAEMTLMFDSGFDVNKEYMDFIISLGIVDQRGAYFKSEEYGFNLQGREKFQEWLDTHPEEYDAIKLRVNDALCSENILDVDNKAEEDEVPTEEDIEKGTEE